MPKSLTLALLSRTKTNSKTSTLEAPFTWALRVSFTTNTGPKQIFGLLESSFTSYSMEILHWRTVRQKFNSKRKCWNRLFSEPKYRSTSRSSFSTVSKWMKAKGLQSPNWWILHMPEDWDMKWTVLKTLKPTHLATTRLSTQRPNSAQEARISTDSLSLRK